MRLQRSLIFTLRAKKINGRLETNMISIKTKQKLLLILSGRQSMVGKNGGGGPVKKLALAQRTDDRGLD